MTKEELEKEAEEWLDERYLKDMGIRKPCKQAYLAGAEPREEQTAHLEKSLLDVTEKSVKRINELEAKIEEMKSDVNECFGYEYNILVAKLLDKWEIKENAELKAIVRSTKAVDESFASQTIQLNKAKKLLTRFVMAGIYFNGKEADLTEEAEQFLKELGE